MNTSTITSSSTTPAAPRARWVRNAWLVAGGLGLTALGIAAGLAWRPAPPAELMAPGSVGPTKASLGSNVALVAPEDKSAGTASTPARADGGTPVPATSHPGSRAPQRASRQGSTSVASGGPAVGDAPALDTQRVAVCATCGVVEGVREVKVKGEGTGLGAVAGGVLGGAVGSQMGRGKGRTAMTVLGAIGGGLAGHEVEKRARSETVYDVRVRMDDGSLRTLRQKSAPAPGSQVTVEGNVLRAVQGGAAPEGARTMRTSADGGGAGA